jgi:hypothetical protein
MLPRPGACLNVIGEAFMVTEMKEFTDWVVAKCPYAPDFIVPAGAAPMVFAALFAQYLANAASSSCRSVFPSFDFNGGRTRAQTLDTLIKGQRSILAVCDALTR